MLIAPNHWFHPYVDFTSTLVPTVYWIQPSVCSTSTSIPPTHWFHEYIDFTSVLFSPAGCFCQYMDFTTLISLHWIRSFHQCVHWFHRQCVDFTSSLIWPVCWFHQCVDLTNVLQWFDQCVDSTSIFIWPVCWTDQCVELSNVLIAPVRWSVMTQVCWFHRSVCCLDGIISVYLAWYWLPVQWVLVVAYIVCQFCCPAAPSDFSR